MRFRGANPVYSRMGDIYSESDNAATYSGVTQKTGLLLAIIAVIALYFGSSINFVTTSIGMLIGTIAIALIIAFISIIMAHKVIELAWLFSLVYASMEGVFLGFISALFMNLYGTEIIITALLATFSVLAGMLFLYSTGIIRVGNMFRKFIFKLAVNSKF